jgi:DNA-binding transcriptional LysR family regulator
MKFYNIIDLIAKFKTLYPEINISLSEFARTTEKEITEKLFNYEYEMVFSDSIFIKSGRIERIDYCKDHLVAVLHNEHRLADSKTIDLKQLANEAFIFWTKNNDLLLRSHYLRKGRIHPKNNFFR